MQKNNQPSYGVSGYYTFSGTVNLNGVADDKCEFCDTGTWTYTFIQLDTTFKCCAACKEKLQTMYPNEHFREIPIDDGTEMFDKITFPTLLSPAATQLNNEIENRQKTASIPQNNLQKVWRVFTTYVEKLFGVSVVWKRNP